MAGTGFCLRPLLTLALFLGLARGLGLQPAALSGEPLLLGSPLLPGGLFPGKLLGALTLEALARGALLGFPAGPGLPLFFFELGAPLGLSELNAHQVAAVHMDRSEEHTSELQSQSNLVCRLLLEKKKKTNCQ